MYKEKYVIQDIDKKNIPSNSLAALVWWSNTIVIPDTYIPTTFS